MVVALMPTVAFADTNYFSVTIDGETTNYPNAGAAVASVGDGQTAVIELLDNYNGGGVKVEGTGKNITFKLNGHTWTIAEPLVGSPGTETNAFQLLRDNTVTFENGVITSAQARILFQNYCDLTLNGVDVSLTTPGTGNYVASNNNGTTVIKGGTVITITEGNTALDSFTFGNYDGANVVIEDAVIFGDVEAANGGKLTLNGGVIDGDVNIYNYTYDEHVSDSSVFVMENGMITGDLNTSEKGNTTINYGFVMGNVGLNNANGASANITGGIFGTIDENVDITSDLTAVFEEADEAYLAVGEEIVSDMIKEMEETLTEEELAQITLRITGAPDGYSLSAPIGLTIMNDTEKAVIINDEALAAGDEITVTAPEEDPTPGADDETKPGDDTQNPPADEQNPTDEEKPDTVKDEEVPKTSNANNMLPWLIIMAAAATGAAGLKVRKNK